MTLKMNLFFEPRWILVVAILVQFCCTVWINTHTRTHTHIHTCQHIDGAGKVDGSIVVALPIDQWSAPYETNEFVGGGLTFWDGGRCIQPVTNHNTTATNSTVSSPPPQQQQQQSRRTPDEIHYDTRSGDVAFIDR
jgi:hypothetical protein